MSKDRYFVGMSPEAFEMNKHRFKRRIPEKIALLVGSVHYPDDAVVELEGSDTPEISGMERETLEYAIAYRDILFKVYRIPLKEMKIYKAVITVEEVPEESLTPV